jgi:hypothetical protein
MRSHATGSARTAHAQSASQVFRAPTALALLTSAGLVSALVGDQGWDLVSWLTLCVPIFVIGWAWRRRC